MSSSSSSSAAPSGAGQILYCLVSRGSVILAEHTNRTGNFTSITQHILEKIPEGDSKMTYVYDRWVLGGCCGIIVSQPIPSPISRHLFHYIQKDGITYMCMADDTFGKGKGWGVCGRSPSIHSCSSRNFKGRRIPFAFLEDIQRRFETSYGAAGKTAIAYGLNEFSKTLATQMVGSGGGWVDGIMWNKFWCTTPTP